MNVLICVCVCVCVSVCVRAYQLIETTFTDCSISKGEENGNIVEKWGTFSMTGLVNLKRAKPFVYCLRFFFIVLSSMMTESNGVVSSNSPTPKSGSKWIKR